MIKQSTTYFLFLFSLVSFSQEYSISGNLKDIDKKSIAFANVVLLEPENASLIQGTTTDDSGNFLLKNIKKGTYILKISFLGFNDYSSEIELNKDLDLNTIILKENLQQLDGITIVSKRPTIKRMVDRLVFNVENSTLSNNNVLDLLKHTPGVLVYDGSITIKQSTPTIYINDRKVHLSTSEVQQLLEGTSANNIKSIEVITNPPAKYEAEGGSVLNIITSKNIISGYNGSVFGNYKQGSEFPKYSFGTSHFFKTKKLNTYVNYSISPRKDYRHNDEFINFIDDNEITTSWETDFKRVRRSENQNINANIDYEINENNNLGFSTNMLISPRKGTKTGINSLTQVFDTNKNLDSTFHTTNMAVDETFNLAFTLDYAHKFKKEGEKLSASLHHTYYDSSNFQDVITGYFLPNDEDSFRDNRFQTFSSQNIKLYTGQIDYELPINESSHFESGIKISKIKSESILNQFTFESDIKNEDLQNSDVFLYDEMNYAAYASYSKDWDKWSLKLGLRSEYTNIKGNSLSTNQINNSDYLKFFPSFYLLNRINNENEIYFNYNKRIYRPRYAKLNPFKYFLNNNSYITGDPNLKPEIDDNFILGYTFNKDYTFELYYMFENDPTIQITYQNNNDKLLKYVNTNINQSISYGLEFTTYTSISKNWNLYLYSSIYYYEQQFYAKESNNELLSNEKWSTYLQIINYFTFLKDKSLIADISLLYISPFITGPININSSTGLDINLRKTLWNNKASLSIGLTDVFNGMNSTQVTKYLNQDILLKSRLENRLFVFGFNYKFGNFRLNSNKKEIDLIERERLN
ncbi:CarboxypepD_reg-like domain-containing protein [Flaviramulus basaltis]|uniref:CarboxypepD_reg-like domain-containing protein n=1 Tax=Flaviramulus basaltis TaxID=369401 RepID=A0A1K2IHG9_9FLAO|nr:outer membrane beta-barrel family protein [Flaviramulus basaltis]SFZ91680.1 CarboxypepD_reg-like domain-containing protein [Flaviramulus basaltis]